MLVQLFHNEDNGYLSRSTIDQSIGWNVSSPMNEDNVSLVKSFYNAKEEGLMGLRSFLDFCMARRSQFY